MKTLCAMKLIFYTIFILSLAGAAGLNLMAANHCFLMDATMNTAIEEQAIDR